MSLFRKGLQAIGNASRLGLRRVTAVRNISHGFVHCNEQVEENLDETGKQTFKIDPRADRSQHIPVITSIQYLESDAYKETYGDMPVWKMYRRNFKGQLPPKKTRKTCIRNQFITTSNACPICRDEYLILDYKNVKLIQQFISPYNGEIISYQNTGLCQRQHQNLLIAIHKAKNYGTITFDVPFRKYDYNEWYNPEIESKDKQ